MLFAQTMQETWFWTCMLIGFFWFTRALKKWNAKRQDDALLNKNPDAWRARQMVELEKQERKRSRVGGAAVRTGIDVAKAFLKK